MRPLKPLAPLSEEDRAYLARGPVYLFDGVCVLCSGAVQYTLKHETPDKTPTRFVAIQSALGRRISEAYGNPPDNPHTFLWFENGEVFERTDAVMGLARKIGPKARMAKLLGIVPRGLRNFVYDRIARNRYAWFGKLDFCMVPDAKTRERFVMPGD
jgi:predicted DCC family thiol-disulfide oxidoreductase YuxK